MEKYCVKCDRIYETEEFFCPKCQNILKPDLVRKKKQQMKQKKEDQEKKTYLANNYTFERYNDRKAPDFDRLLETSLQAKFDFKHRIEAISIDEMESQVEKDPQKYNIYACSSCDHFVIGYCFKHDWNIEAPSINLCRDFMFLTKLKEPIYDKRVQQFELENIDQLEDKTELQKRYSFETLKDILIEQQDKVLTFFNQSNHLNHLPKVTDGTIDKIVSKREQSEFNSINKLITATNLKDPIGVVALRLLQELNYNCQNYILLSPPKWIKEEFQVVREI